MHVYMAVFLGLLDMSSDVTSQPTFPGASVFKALGSALVVLLRLGCTLYLYCVLLVPCECFAPQVPVAKRLLEILCELVGIAVMQLGPGPTPLVCTAR